MVQPPGTYCVVTLEAPAGLLSIFKAPTSSTLIRVCANPGVAGILQLVKIDPLDLATALTPDAVTSEVDAPEQRSDERDISAARPT